MYEAIQQTQKQAFLNLWIFAHAGLEATTQGIHGTTISILNQADFPHGSKQAMLIKPKITWCSKQVVIRRCMYMATLVYPCIPVYAYSTSIQFIIVVNPFPIYWWLQMWYHKLDFQVAIYVAM